MAKVRVPAKYLADFKAEIEDENITKTTRILIFL